jgi:hypothetical protein
MAHYAFLNENNIVTEVIVGIDETETIDGLLPETWYGDYRSQVCVRTSYNGKIRKQFAGVGFTYNPIADVFISPQPFASWTLDNNYDWQPPTAVPTDGKNYSWDETLLQWVEIEVLIGFTNEA